MSCLDAAALPVRGGTLQERNIAMQGE